MSDYNDSSRDSESVPGGTETAIQESLAAFVDGLRMPADLLDRAIAGNRRRIVRRRLIGGASLAVAAVAAVIMVPGRLPGGEGRPLARGTGPAVSASKSPAGPSRSRSARPPAVPQAESAAAILEHAAVNSERMISVTKAPGGTIYTDVAAQRQRIVSTKVTAAGLPYYQIGTAVKDGTETQTTVVNPDRVYSVLVMPAGSSGITSGLPLQTSPDPATAISKALDEGAITPAGHQDLNGQDTAVYRVGALTPGQMAAYGLANTGKGGRIWVNAATDLIVRTDFLQSTATGWRPVVINVSWLAPTSQNLGSLTVSPPAGFAQVPYSEAARDLGPIS